MVWISYTGWGTKAYRDDGTVLTMVKDMSTNKAVISVDRIAVDRKTERVYFNDAWSGIYQVSNWDSPVVSACSSTSGRIYGADMCVSPTGYLYVREGQSYNGSVTRYTLDHKHAPAPFANTGSHVMTPYIYSRMHGVGGYGERGFDVNKQGKLAIEYMYTFGPYFIGMLGDSGQRCTGETTGVVDTIIKPINGYYANCGGVKFDTKGNLYMGMKGKPEGFVVPDPFKNDDTYNRGIGVVARYPVGGKGSVAYNSGIMSFPGADKVYLSPLSPFSSAWGECACRTPRFDIDLFDRLYLPDALSNQVRVLDIEGNVLLTFGEYGNWDSQGPGSLIPTTSVPLGWPVGAVSTDNYIYVADMINSRVVRTRKTFILDNMPGSHTVTEGTVQNRKLHMTANPNPFNPISQLSVTLPNDGQATLAIYDIRGRLVKTLVQGKLRAGLHRFTFDGKDLISGMYFARLVVPGHQLETRIMLVK
ncbi:MAG: T9SS type A sorting domain-containing protein [Fibrobacteres bacterium]|nr:T9SS type A sorting domain-containing protein [Fibrobacterota bacterium]